MALSTDGIVFDVLSADPGSPVEGQLWFNTTDKMLKMYRASGGTSAVQAKANITTTNPLVTSDSSLGYAVGSRWINSSTAEEFVCLDSTTSAAVWKSTTAQGEPTIPTPSVVTSSGTTTSATSYAVVDMLTLTPGAGNYLVLYSTSLSHSTANGTIDMAVHVNEVIVTNTTRSWYRGGAQGNIGSPMVIQAYITGVTAGQAVSIQWKTNSGTATAGQGTFILIKAN